MKLINVPILNFIIITFIWLIERIDKIIYSLSGKHDIGLCLVLFCFLLYILFIPFIIKNHIFSKINEKITPLMRKIQDKYKGKRDRDSQIEMQKEIRELYAQHGTNQMVGCLNIFLQMPVIICFYNVINNIPLYISSVRAMFHNSVLVHKILAFNSVDKAKFINLCKSGIFKKGAKLTENKVIEALWSFDKISYDKFISKFPKLSNEIGKFHHNISSCTNIFCYNILQSPWNMLKENIIEKHYILCLSALLIPILTAGLQYINMLLGPQMKEGASPIPFKKMNIVLLCVTFCFSFWFPIGISICWIISSIIRNIVQYCVNKYIKKVGLNKIIERRRNKKGIKEKKIDYTKKQEKKSILSKASMVKEFNKLNNEKE